MSLSISLQFLISAVLLSTRLGMVLVLTPILGGQRLPVQLRVFFVFAFALALLSLVPAANSVPVKLDAISLMLALLCEIIWGAFFAFAWLAAFSAFMVAGRILDLQIGFGLANLVDPATKNNAPLLGTVLETFAVVCFLALNLHHWVIRILAESIKQIPLGSSPLSAPWQALVNHFVAMFSLGIVLVGAVIVCLLLLDVGMSVAARVLPQMNIFILSIPIKIFVGLLMLAIAVPYMQPTMQKIFQQALMLMQGLVVR